MGNSKVYYLNGRSHNLQTSLVSQMLTVFDEAGLAELVRAHDIVAIKIHCGDWNNTGYLRPVYPRALADRIKDLGGRPFVCDTITLPYGNYGYRVTGLEMITTAARNGLTSATLGCPFVVADGFNGTDDVRVELPEGMILREAYVAKAIALADVLVVLTHFKGHAAGVIGGSLKNLGIGAQSRRGKANVHMSRHPRYGMAARIAYRPERCVGRAECAFWQHCEDSCPYGLFHVQEHGLGFDLNQCRDCLRCPGIRTQCGVMTRDLEVARDYYRAMNVAIADGALAVTKAVGRDKVGFVNMAIDISPYCDCAPFSDSPIVPNLGVLAGKDPVALDKACVDLAKEAGGNRNSLAEDRGVMDPGVKKFETISAILEGISEETQMKAAAHNGLGSTDYELVEVDSRPDVTPFLPCDDGRVAGLRLRRVFEREDPIPWERFEGRGFERLEEIDLSRFA